MATHPVPDTASTAALDDVQKALTVLITTGGSEVSERELIDHLRALEDAKASICAAQATLSIHLDTTVRARHEQARIPTSRQGRDVAGLIAYARRESPAKGSKLLGFAHALTEQPHTHAAMRAGVLSEWRAMLITRETACLTREDRALVDAEISAPGPDGTYPFDTWGDRRLTAETQKAVVALDPQAVVNRRAKAETDRRVSMRPAPDTMAQLTAILPAAQGVAVWATLTRVADQARATGDPRSRDQVMADTLVERITGQTTADAVPVTVNLVISDQALLDGGHQPAWLQGYGPIPADTIDPESLVALRRLYATPATGALVAMESIARDFPAGLARLIDLRDRTCRTPYCDAPIRHHDHPHDHALGGPTTGLNGQGLCEHCNHTKQAPGWTARPINGPPGQLHQIETTLPTGHTIRSTAPPMPQPSRLRPVSRAEFEMRSIVLQYAA
jgi:predicted hotdog family 3-hydroxylacyl-ACP dehydratase